MQALKNFRTYFFRGLAALLPTILTVWIFVQLYLFLQHNVSSHINRGVVRILVYAAPHYPYISEDEVLVYVKDNFPAAAEDQQLLQDKTQDFEVKRAVRVEKAEKFWVYGRGQMAGLLIAFVIVIFVGALLASFIGKALWRILERAFMKTPVIRKIYPYIKQVTDFFLTREKMTFSRVVAVEYPRKGSWSIAMVTGAGLQKINENQQKEFITLFVPTSPTPFTGYVIIVPKNEVIEMGMTVEEALRFTVSGGVISPAIFDSYSEEKNTAELKELKDK